MQITQSTGLHRPAHIQRRTFEGVRQISHDQITDGLAQRTIQNEAKRAFSVVLANEDNCTLKKEPPNCPLSSSSWPRRNLLFSAIDNAICTRNGQVATTETGRVRKAQNKSAETFVSALEFTRQFRSGPGRLAHYSDFTFFTIAAASMPNAAISSAA